MKILLICLVACVIACVSATLKLRQNNITMSTKFKVNISIWELGQGTQVIIFYIVLKQGFIA